MSNKAGHGLFYILEFFNESFAFCSFSISLDNKAVASNDFFLQNECECVQ